MSIRLGTKLIYTWGTESSSSSKLTSVNVTSQNTSTIPNFTVNDSQDKASTVANTNAICSDNSSEQKLSDRD